MVRLNSRLGQPLAILSLLGSLGGCTTPLPDATPFHKMTLELRSAIAAGLVVVEGELRAAELNEEADQLNAERCQRLAAADSMVAYAESIKMLTDAGNKGNETVAAAVNSLESLGKATGVTMVTNAAFISIKLFKELDNIRARSTLTEVIQKAQPLVTAGAVLVAKEIGNMTSILRTAADRRVTDHEKERKNDTNKRERVLEKRRKLWEGIHCKSVNAETVRDCLARLEVLGHGLKVMDEWYLPFEAKRKAILDRETAGRKLLAATKYAVLDWASAHSQLALAIENGWQVDPKALAESIVEIRDLIRRMRVAQVLYASEAGRRCDQSARRGRQ